MGKLTESTASQVPPTPRRMLLDEIMDDFDDDDRNLLLSWLHDRSVSDETIELRLDVIGVSCSDSSVRRWRRFNGVR